MEYENMIETICTEHWKDNEVEKDGGLGVACVLAYMKGVKPKLEDLARHLKLDPKDIERPFNRLLVNGIFNAESYNARNDKALLGKTDPRTSRTAYCILAGISSGLCGLRET